MSNRPPKTPANCASLWPLIALGALAVVAGAFHGSALALAFGLPVFLAPIALIAILWRSLESIVVTRSQPSAVFEGEEVEVTITLENQGRLPVFFPTVTDVFTPEFHTVKVTYFPYRIRAGETVRETYRGKALLPRGSFRLGPIVLSVSDPFGWVQLKKNFSRRARMKVYPAIQTCGPVRLEGRAVDSRREERSLRIRGESLEFFTVREYRVGDSPRRIHWPLSARHGTPVVREFAQPTSGSVRFVLDLSRQGLIGVGRGSSLEHAIRLTVSLAHQALRSGHDIALVGRGRREFGLPSGRGPEQFRRLLDEVIGMRPDGTVTLPELLGEHRSELERGGTIVYPVSPYLYFRKDFLAEVARLRRLGLRQIALVFDEQTFRALSYEESTDLHRASDFVATLRASGVDPYRITCGVPFDLLFNAPAA